VAKTVAHRDQPLDGLVELVSFGCEDFAADARSTVWGEHVGDLVERETRGAPQGDHGEAIEHAGREESP
jgi:hypothetical protein